MFQELMPLLSQRRILLMISWVDVETICVNFIPQLLKESKNDNAALTTPLSLIGTPQELDQKLPEELTEFVGAHLQLSSTLRAAKEEMDAAAKSAKEAAKKSSSTVVKTSPKAATAPTPTMGADPSAVEENAPTTGSLFAATT